MKLGILGCGNMAGAMVGRWLASGTVDPADVVAVTRTEDEAATVRRTLGIACGTDVQAAIRGRDVVLLGIKPQQAAEFLPALAAQAPPGQVWLSILAGLSRQKVARLLNDRVEVVRLMPNTPARIGLGATAVCFGPATAEPDRQRVLRLLSALGQVLEIPESSMDVFTAIAGSGPAYVFLFMEALAEAGQALGLEIDVARALASQMVQGAAGLAVADGRAPGELRREVTSPGGTTEAALKVLVERDWPAHVREAVTAAARRSAEMAG